VTDLQTMKDRDRKSRRSPAGRQEGSGWDAEDIVEAGEDVTSKYSTGPPGLGPSLIFRLLSILNSPWIVAIGGGLIVAIGGGIILAWLVLKLKLK